LQYCIHFVRINSNVGCAAFNGIDTAGVRHTTLLRERQNLKHILEYARA